MTNITSSSQYQRPLREAIGRYVDDHRTELINRGLYPFQERRKCEKIAQSILSQTDPFPNPQNPLFKNPGIEGHFYRSTLRFGGRIVIVDRYNGNSGAHKTMNPAYEAAKDTFRKAALVRTKPDTGTIYNRRELDFLQSQITNPIPGAVPVYYAERSQNQSSNSSDMQFSALLQLCDCDLFSLVMKPELTPAGKRKCQEAILLACGDLESRRIAHRDIKPENLLLKIESPRHLRKCKNIPEIISDPDSKISVFVCDFSYAEKMQQNPNPTSIYVGSIPYISPEVAYYYVAKQTYTPSLKGDLWALGLILLALENPEIFECIFSRALNASDNRPSIQQNSDYFSLGQIPEFPEPEKDAFLHTIWQLMQPKPEKRPSIQVVLEAFYKRAASEPPLPEKNPYEGLKEMFKS